MADPKFKAVVGDQIVEIDIADTATKQKADYIAIIYFPAAFTPVCADELPEHSDHNFEGVKVQLIGVSTDSIQDLQKWVKTPKEQGGLGRTLNFPIISDPKRILGGKKGFAAKSGRYKRGTMLYEAQGDGAYKFIPSFIHLYPEIIGREPSDLNVILEKLKISKDTGGKCPNSEYRRIKSEKQGIRGLID